MRAQLRGEKHCLAYVHIGRVDELRALQISDHDLRVGAGVTHADLARFLLAYPEYRALAQAAGNSANPQVRNMATIGGNLCAAEFAAADLVPALLCLDAEVELGSHAGRLERMPLSAFLAMRGKFGAGTLLSHVLVPRRPRRSTHVRLPLRKAGDYPVAIVSMSCAVAGNGSFSDLRIAVGSVDRQGRLWPGLQEKLAGGPLDPAAAAIAAAQALGDLSARDGVDAPGWYRLQVLPALVRRAVEDIRRGN